MLSLILLILPDIDFKPDFTTKLIIWHAQCWWNISLLPNKLKSFLKSYIALIFAVALSNVMAIILSLKLYSSMTDKSVLFIKLAALC